MLTLPQVADRLDLPIARVHQLVRDGELIVLTPESGPRSVPADFIDDTGVVKSLPAVIRLLRDAKYTDAEIVDWLHAEDDSLPGTPIAALRANRGTEIKRRAQAAG